MLRNYYVNKLGFLPTALTPSNLGVLHVRSDDEPRTVLSAQGVLLGLFPPKTTIPYGIVFLFFFFSPPFFYSLVILYISFLLFFFILLCCYSFFLLLSSFFPSHIIIFIELSKYIYIYIYLLLGIWSWTFTPARSHWPSWKPTQLFALVFVPIPPPPLPNSFIAFVFILYSYYRPNSDGGPAVHCLSKLLAVCCRPACCQGSTPSLSIPPPLPPQGTPLKYFIYNVTKKISGLLGVPFTADNLEDLNDCTNGHFCHGFPLHPKIGFDLLQTVCIFLFVFY